MKKPVPPSVLEAAEKLENKISEPSHKPKDGVHCRVANDLTKPDKNFELKEPLGVSDRKWLENGGRSFWDPDQRETIARELLIYKDMYEALVVADSYYNGNFNVFKVKNPGAPNLTESMQKVRECLERLRGQETDKKSSK